MTYASSSRWSDAESAGWSGPEPRVRSNCYPGLAVERASRATLGDQNVGRIRDPRPVFLLAARPARVGIGSIWRVKRLCRQTGVAISVANMTPHDGCAEQCSFHGSMVSRRAVGVDKSPKHSSGLARAFERNRLIASVDINFRFARVPGGIDYFLKSDLSVLTFHADCGTMMCTHSENY
jgi:hypothetical protein